MELPLRRWVALAGGYVTEAWGLRTALWVFGGAYLVTTLVT